MDPDAEKRLDRFEQKIDTISDKLSAFPVVGQRIVDIERRVEHMEKEVHEIRLEVGTNTLSLTKVFAWIAMGSALVVLAIRELMRQLHV